MLNFVSHSLLLIIDCTVLRAKENLNANDGTGAYVKVEVLVDNNEVKLKGKAEISQHEAGKKSGTTLSMPWVI